MAALTFSDLAYIAGNRIQGKTPYAVFTSDLPHAYAYPTYTVSFKPSVDESDLVDIWINDKLRKITKISRSAKQININLEDISLTFDQGYGTLERLYMFGMIVDYTMALSRQYMPHLSILNTVIPPDTKCSYCNALVHNNAAVDNKLLFYHNKCLT
jgi:hypothetical protein